MPPTDRRTPTEVPDTGTALTPLAAGAVLPAPGGGAPARGEPLTAAEQRRIMREWFDRKAATTIRSYRFSLAEFAAVVGADFATLDAWVVAQGPGGLTRALRRYKRALTTRVRTDARSGARTRGLAPASVNAPAKATTSTASSRRPGFFRTSASSSAR